MRYRRFSFTANQMISSAAITTDGSTVAMHFYLPSDIDIAKGSTVEPRNKVIGNQGNSGR